MSVLVDFDRARSDYGLHVHNNHIHREDSMNDLQYPIGRLERKAVLTDVERRRSVEQVAETPANMKKATVGLSADQLDTPYRLGGWTVRQVVHHVADSHMNAYIRMKLALTESHPTIKVYNEKLWAELYDVQAVPVEVSLTLLESLHGRWVAFLHSLSPGDFARTLVHPEQGVITVDFLLNLYGWHGRHHVAHITSLRDRMGWK
jgi:hypothetical protein